MKFCPYCGASIAGSAASFCSECGKKIPTKESALSKNSRPLQRHPVPKERKQRSGQGPKARPHRRKNPMDVNYDGYYNDIQPIDAGHQSERMDPDMIKKIVLLLTGAVFIVILAAALMVLL